MIIPEAKCKASVREERKGPLELNAVEKISIIADEIWFY